MVHIGIQNSVHLQYRIAEYTSIFTCPSPRLMSKLLYFLTKNVLISAMMFLLPQLYFPCIYVLFSVQSGRDLSKLKRDSDIGT